MSYSTRNRSFQTESFQAIDWTGTSIKNNETKHYIHPKRKRETEHTAIANKNSTLTWYAFNDLRPGNAAGPFLTVPEPAWAVMLEKAYSRPHFSAADSDA